MVSNYHLTNVIQCYTPLKDKCDAIRNLKSTKTLTQMSFLWNGKFHIILFTQPPQTIDTDL